MPCILFIVRKPSNQFINAPTESSKREESLFDSIILFAAIDKFGTNENAVFT